MLTAVLSLSAIARHHGLDINTDRLIRDYALGQEEPSPRKLVHMARDVGLRAKLTRLTWEDAIAAGEAYPFLVRLKDGEWRIVSGYKGEGGDAGELVLSNVASGRAGFEFRDRETFCGIWTGEAVLLKRHYRLEEVDRPFGIGWFVPEIWRNRGLLRDVAVSALCLYALGLTVPLYFQIIIDKVLVHQGYTTLYVLTGGVLLALVFDAVFSYLRRYLILHASNKIDIRVVTRTFAHLMHLPLDFFEHAPAGVLVKHMQQAEKIREFLTGRLFLTLVDGLALFAFLPVLLYYSIPLTIITLAYAIIIALTILMLIRPFRSRLRTLYEVEARRQSLLVEAIEGMRTVKSLAIEPQQRRVWDGWSARALMERTRVGRISIAAQTAMASVEKLMLVTIVGVGTFLVFDEKLTVGALVAFQMLASRVSNPLIQIVGLVHEYQETALSVRMLGNIMNARPERGNVRGIQPPIQGAVEFQDVTFRYEPNSEPAVNNLSVTIQPGTVFGIVGASGSGKTTVTRLLQGLYSPQSGVIRLDGHDLREYELSYLRSRLGIVLQDSFLFRGTVRENIAIGRPGMPFEEVVAAARLAGAEEFIERLPRGFDTPLEENGSNLSGGQRQRLAIARALIARPPILIFDEATSALDPHSEVIIQRNLRSIASGRTLIIVSHRLSALMDADNILVMDGGRMVGLDRHRELLATCPIYSNLWRQQRRETV